MNQILKEFIENMFLTIKETPEIKQVKSDLLNSTNDKYFDLVENGLSENEALGKVIAEFGSIEEILNQMDISVETKKDISSKIIDKDIVIKEHKANLFYYKMISIGVSLNILLIGTLSYLSELDLKNHDLVFFLTILISLIIPISLYIFYGYKISNEIKITKGLYNLTKEAEYYINKQTEKFKNTFIIKIVVGVILSILGIIVISLTSFNIDIFNNILYNHILAFTIIALAVYLFITATSNKNYLALFIKKEEQTAELINQTTKNDQLIDKVSSIIMLIATIIFLSLGFI